LFIAIHASPIVLNPDLLPQPTIDKRDVVELHNTGDKTKTATATATATSRPKSTPSVAASSSPGKKNIYIIVYIPFFTQKDYNRGHLWWFWHHTSKRYCRCISDSVGSLSYGLWFPFIQNDIGCMWFHHIWYVSYIYICNSNDADIVL
jgi:hypothetical protein